MNTEPTPGHLVWRLSMKWRAAVDRALAPLGLTHAQYVLLASLYGMERDGQRPTRRERDPADTRAVRLALTGRGTPRAKAFLQDLAALLDTPLDQ
jgi:MarR family transcriptional regulator, organic hydroperoxide resistance regulator